MRLFLLLALMLCTGICAHADEDELRGVWVSSVYNMDYPVKPTGDAGELRNMADEIVDNCAEIGINAVFLQVRPMCDALYKSEIFPWSEYLTGKQGTAPSDGFDPLDYWIKKCHEKNIELHAWINPYRIAKDGGAENLSANNPARLHPDWTVESEGGLYFDPGEPEVRRLVTDGACEIAENYDVDGIHLDDYFYPSQDFDDAESFARYGGGMAIDDWRRSNTETLIKEMGEEIHRIKKDISFGVSPCGIWANKSDMEEGSDTSGNSAYKDMYADTLKWASDGIIDYIAPQIYWYSGYEPADYTVLLNWWSEKLSGCDTKLYIGLADYRLDAYGENKESPWYDGNEIARQMDMNSNNEKVSGEIHFRYGSLLQYDSLREKVRAKYTSDTAESEKDTDSEVCLYIYLNSMGAPVYIWKDGGGFDMEKCRAHSVNGAVSVRWVRACDGEEIRENL